MAIRIDEVKSSSAPDSEGFGDHPDQYTGDPVWRLRVPGAGAASWQDRAAIPIGPARSRRWPGSGRPGVRREYDHQPGAPAASCVAPCAFAAVRDITGRMLLVRRCDTGDWELPGGHVDPGESALDGALGKMLRGAACSAAGAASCANTVGLAAAMSVKLSASDVVFMVTRLSVLLREAIVRKDLLKGLLRWLDARAINRQCSRA